MAAMVGLWALVVALTVSLAATEARANPDVWVETKITVAFDEQRVSGLDFLWVFDDFYSAHTIQTYDLDGDGTLNPLEVRSLRAETFDPLSPADYFVHIWSGEKKQGGFDVDRFAARIEQARLVYEFSLGLTPPLDPKAKSVSVSLFDRENFVDFSFSDSPFLLVSGEMAPGCKFRIARGAGAQSGHPQPVTLACDG
ncbi:MAG: DUF1007 family protein [Rhodospirillaceae bacterium]|nr:DUF1007 family protein [Rhodospirillaceae bacterium]